MAELSPTQRRPRTNLTPLSPHVWGDGSDIEEGILPGPDGPSKKNSQNGPGLTLTSVTTSARPGRRTVASSRRRSRSTAIAVTPPG